MADASASHDGDTSPTPDDMGSDTTQHPIFDGDGRNRRRARNRDAVIRALIELFREGDLNPTVAKIADRAQLSDRSVFRYFDDLNDLARTAIAIEFVESWSLALVDDVGEGSLDERIDSLVDARVRFLDRVHLPGIVARARITEIAEVGTGFDKFHEGHVDQIERHFAQELDAMPEPRAEAVITAIATITGLDNYDRHRRRVCRTPTEIADLWSRTLHVLLT